MLWATILRSSLNRFSFSPTTTTAAVLPPFSGLGVAGAARRFDWRADILVSAGIVHSMFGANQKINIFLEY